MDHSGFINRLTGLFSTPSYLQIGGDLRETFFAVEANSKTAVGFDGQDFSSVLGDRTQDISPLKSDDFFRRLNLDRKFDVILIDGYHTFEQTLRDLLNAIVHSHEKTIIIIDNVFPNSYAASISSIEEWTAFRAALGIEDQSWMGDVYKCVRFIDAFLPAFSFATSSDNRGQLLLWRSSRTPEYVSNIAMHDIVDLSYKNIVANREFMRFSPFSMIFEKIKQAICATPEEALSSLNVEIGQSRSCSFFDLYRNGGFYDNAIVKKNLEDLDSSNSNVISSQRLFDDLSYNKEIENLYVSGVVDEELQKHYAYIDRSFPRLPSVNLFKISNVLLWKNVLFFLEGNTVRPVYEMSRECDRPEQSADFTDRLKDAIRQKGFTDGPSDALFIGSAGSFNYGHWLIDDLPRLSAVLGGAMDHNVKTVVSTSFQQGIDDVRTVGFKLCAESYSIDIDVMLLDPDCIYTFDKLNFVTPVSYHPVLKHPLALNGLQENLNAIIRRKNYPVNYGKRIFVNRRSSGLRKISNLSEVSAILLDAGFQEVFPEEHTFGEQLAMFANADQIVGIMGAAMCNVLVCNSDADILYLAPAGWSEPFYWDLAAVLGQKYHVSFGPPVETHSASHLRDFEVDTKSLVQYLNRFKDA